MIFQWIQMLLVLLFETQEGPKYDLRRKPTKETYKYKVNLWVQRNFYIICIAIIILLFVAFVGFCFMIVGVSGVESGTYYNHFQEVVR